MKIEIYDSTLREGEQSATVSFSKSDKIKIIEALDRLGVSYIEAGMVTSLKFVQHQNTPRLIVESVEGNDSLSNDEQ